MLISGLKRRSIADQNGTVEFRFVVNSPASIGRAQIGLTGTRGFTFTLENGKIYDTNDKFVGSYDRGVPVTISGQVGQSVFDYYINETLVALGNPIDTGVYSWLYVNSDHEIDFDGYVKGATPDYSLETVGKYQYENFVVSGKVINNDPSRKFRIFDVTVDQPSSPYWVKGFTTGDIDGTGFIELTSDQIGLNDYIVPLTLYTNFGPVPVNFTVSGDHSVVPDIFLNISPDTTNVVNEVAKHYTIQFSNHPAGGELGIKLEYEDGTTGNIYKFATAKKAVSKVVTADITGSQIVSIEETGIVSGEDPKTNIIETGAGAGILNSAIVYAYGFTTQDYNIEVRGFGEGLFETNYLASGYAYGAYNGVIPLTGGYVDLIAYNFVGTGENPGVATGLVPVGTGKYFAFPTGCVTVESPLVYEEDYYSGIIFADKVFQGTLEIPYKTLAVGWATGGLFEGIVDTRFPLRFEPGMYYFKKYFKGDVSGWGMNTGMFEPTGCLEEVPTSGLIEGYFETAVLLDCNATTGLPMLKITGFPDSVYDGEKRKFQPHRVVQVQPINGFDYKETSKRALAGEYTRTMISRLGETPSGTGYFQNVISECLHIGDVQNPVNMQTHLWKETMPSNVKSGVFDSDSNVLAYVGTDAWLNETGDFDGINFFGDSGILSFGISGSGKKTVALRGLDLDTNGARTFEFYLFKDAAPTHIMGVAAREMDPERGFDQASPWQKWRAVIEDGTKPYDTVIVLDDLTSGNYTLYAIAVPTDPVTIYFKGEVVDTAYGNIFGTPTISGCEASKNLVVSVCADGDIYEPIWFEITEYEELTAHSGVNYDPVYLVYTEENRKITGKNPNARIGGYIEPNFYTDDESDSTEACYQFTIPIYDNATYGKDHEFIIRLSNVSGSNAFITAQEAVIRIVDNDNIGFVTGINSGFQRIGTVENDENGDPTIVPANIRVMDGTTETTQGLYGLKYSSVPNFKPIQIDCSPVPPIVTPPPPCWPLPEWMCNKVSEPCPAVTGEVDCCHCDNTVTTTINCPGYDNPLTINYLPRGAVCGSVSAGGCGPTTGAIFMGELCSRQGASLVPAWTNPKDEHGECTYTFNAFPKDCVNSDDDGGCPNPDGTPDIDWEHCEDGTCVGGCDENGENCSETGFTGHCPDYAKKKKKKNGKKKRPIGPKCDSLLVFATITCSRDHHYSEPCPDIWGWGLQISAVGQMNASGPVCPPPPPRQLGTR